MDNTENLNSGDERPYKNEKKVPDVVKEEANDKPAGKMIKWVIAIAVILLILIYAFFFHPADSNW
ncbi:hypothetical protein [Sphingobacterium corticibacter]|uniref:Uncharacterized protein n=1 Tax=Sphingobacterium corticibacter TaxID=2171749 RepID=A0A2T8HMX1_9SPHI|nr:hypothetical protein [Sphingobacterium corticibacter]PVH26753.1 hypothetical protein DC487_03875 [Sphingobacterium corticibacter]